MIIYCMSVRISKEFTAKPKMCIVATMSIVDRIQESRKTDSQLSREVGVAVPVVWRWRRGFNLPSLNNVGALALALDCGVRDLLPESKT